MDTGSEPNQDQSKLRRCVVWHRCGNASSPALLGALSSRGLGSRWGVETSSSGHEVLAMGCREQQRGLGLIVVLDAGGVGGAGDGDLDQQGRIIEAMERFCPSALVWVYQEGANPPIRGFVGEKAGHDVASPKIESEQRARTSQAPALRLSGQGQESQGLESHGAPKTGPALLAADVLDQDELAALLEPDRGSK